MNPLVGVKTTAENGNGNFGLKKGMRGKRTQGADDFRMNDLKLFNQKRFTGRDLIWLRISVARWSALQNIADINVLTV